MIPFHIFPRCLEHDDCAADNEIAEACLGDTSFCGTSKKSNKTPRTDDMRPCGACVSERERRRWVAWKATMIVTPTALETQ